MHQTDNLIVALFGLATTFVGVLFDVPAPTLFAACAGSCFGVAIGDQVGRIKGAALILAGTIIAGYFVPVLLDKLLPGANEKALAFALALVVIWQRGLILTEVPKLVKQGFDAAGRAITRWGGGDA